MKVDPVAAISPVKQEGIRFDEGAKIIEASYFRNPLPPLSRA